MTVTYPQGFLAIGVSAGLKSTGRPDLAIVINTGPLRTGTAVFTSNRAKANPIIWSRQAIASGHIDAIVLNSGGANCFTGQFGFDTARQTAELTATHLTTDATHIQVCSTGLIGEGSQEFRDNILRAIPSAVAAATPEGGRLAAEAIMTTDTVPKIATFDGDGWRIGAMAKGAGMLAPGLATMLVVITSDAVLDTATADRALRSATQVSFDRLDSDGCMSTNDQVTLMVSGASDTTPSAEDFTAALTTVCLDLAAQLLADAEGSSHDIAINVVGAATVDEALTVGRSVARNNLFKAAVFGNDPNWGRVLAAIGTTDAQFDPYDTDVWMNGVRVCTQGQPDRPRTDVDLTPRAMDLLIDLKTGTESATIWTNDLTHDYVHENSAYSS